MSNCPHPDPRQLATAEGHFCLECGHLVPSSKPRAHPSFNPKIPEIHKSPGIRFNSQTPLDPSAPANPDSPANRNSPAIPGTPPIISHSLTSTTSEGNTSATSSAIKPHKSVRIQVADIKPAKPGTEETL